MRYIFYILGGGELLSTFCPRGQGGGVCKMSAYDNLAFCTYFGIDALKTKKKAYMYADVHLLNFYTYVCTYDSYILFFLWLNTYIDANQFYIWMYDYVHFFFLKQGAGLYLHM